MQQDDDPLHKLKQSAPYWWYHNIKVFSDGTTFHGIKYVFASSRYFIRKFLWLLILLVACVLFGFMLANNIVKLRSYPVSVDITDDYTSPLTFPAVTVCNGNKFRMTSLFGGGLYDIVKKLETNENLDELKYGRINFNPLVCNISRAASSAYLEKITLASLSTCRYFCNVNFNAKCSGIFWQRLLGQCWLTSYTGDYDDDVTCLTNTTARDHAIFFRRRRVPYGSPIYCDMERSDYCPLDLAPSDTCSGTFYMVAASTTSASSLTDVTLGRTSAHVLYLTSLISSSPTPTCADATTEYVDITNKCLLLHYMWLYAGTLQIFVQDEGRGMHLVTSVTSSEQPHLIGQWRPLFVSLPARQGMHQIVIRALRTSDKYGSGTTGVAIDDITVRYCTDFKRNCLLSASGAEYAGPVSVSSDGQTCEHWTNTVLPQYQLDIIANYNAVLYANMTSHTNQCRNPDYDPRGPWCYNSAQEKMYCDIQYCDCPRGWFTCTSGQCILGNERCDGTTQCADGSDESLTTCGGQASPLCDFNKKTCGYGGFIGMASIWITGPNAMKIDANWQSFVTPSVTAWLVSPVSAFSQPITVSVQAVFWGGVAVNVYVLRDGRIVRPTAALVTTPYLTRDSIMRLNITACLLPGYSLAYAPMVARDEVQFLHQVGNAAQTGTGCSLYTGYSSGTPSISCTFTSSDQCGYWATTDHVFYQWKLIGGRNSTIAGAHEPLKYAATLTQSTAANYKYPRAVLVSGTQHIAQSSCVHFELYYASGVSISARVPRCVASGDDDGLLLRVTSPLGDAWHHVWLPLDVTDVTGCDAQLQFEVFYDITSTLPTNAAVANFTVNSGRCTDTSPSTSFSCDFTNDVNQCAYRDVSTTPTRWLRRKVTKKDIYLPVTLFSADVTNALLTINEGTSIIDMTSPSSSALQLNYPADSDSISLQVSLFAADAPILGLPLSVAIATDEPLSTWSCQSNDAMSLTYFSKLMQLTQSAFNVTCATGNSSTNGSVLQFKVTGSSVLPTGIKSALHGANIRHLSISDVSASCAQCSTTIARRRCLTATDDNLCSTTTDAGDCALLGCCLTANNRCLPSLLASDADVMSVTMSSGSVSKSRLVSPLVSAVTRDTCLSFLVHFNATAAAVKLIIGTTVTDGSADADITILGTLQYPFDHSLYVQGDSSQLFRIHLPLNPGTYRLVFVVESSGEATVSVWDIQHTTGTTCAASRFLRYANSSTAGVAVPSLSGSGSEVNDPRRPESIPGLYDNDTFVNNDQQLIAAVLEQMKSQNLEEFALIAGHYANRTIIQCQWNGKTTCPAGSITQRFTDMGYCLTFNFDYSLQSTNAGSQFGLRLVLNAEDYEQVEGIDVISGFKVFMFDPTQQIERMSQVSYSVSPGTATAISLSVDHNMLLSPPYGVCGSQPLAYYDSYSRSRCEMECQTNNLIDNCGCIDVYMPGNHTQCSVGDYLSCAWNQPLTQKFQDCLSNCSLSCDEIEYSGTISFAQLSSQSTKEVLSTSYDAIEAKYNMATELSDRLSYSKIEIFLTSWANVTELTNEYAIQIQQFFNVGNQLQTALQMYNKIVVQYDRDIYFQVISQFSNFYRSKYKVVRDSAAKYTFDAVACVKDVYTELLASPTGFNKFSDARWYFTQISALVNNCMNDALLSLTYLPRAVASESDNQYQFAPQNFYANRSVATSCSNVYSNTEETLKKHFVILHYVSDQLALWLSDNAAAVNTPLTSELSTYLSQYNRSINASNLVQSTTPQTGNLTGNNSNNNTSSNIYLGIWPLLAGYLDQSIVSSQLQNVDVAISNQVSQCLTNYEELLNDALKSASQSILEIPVLSATPASVNATNFWSSANTDLESAIHDYITGAVLGRDTANRLNLIFNGMMNNMQVTSDENFQTFKAWLNELAQWQNNAFLLYSSIINTSIALLTQPLSDSAPLRTAISIMNLWMQLRVAIVPEIDVYYLNQFITEDRQAISQLALFYLTTYARAQVVQYLDEVVIQDVTWKIQPLSDELRSSYNNWLYYKTAIDASVQDYLATFTVDDNFLMRNFILLDIYYDQLRVYTTEQSPAYDLVSFFSDLGGLLGLFLGGSAISIFEILDLFVYNLAIQLAFQQAVSKSKYRQRHDNTSPKDIEHNGNNGTNGHYHQDDDLQLDSLSTSRETKL